MPTCVKLTLIFFMCLIKGSTQIQNVKLIVPTVVQAGSSATLLCLYDLEGASLYSVQWYRGQLEFFRFVPHETPSTKVFHTRGLYVDTHASNDHQVTLTNIPVQISGEFSCEITTDAPPFSTSCVSQNLTVIDFTLSLEVPKRQYYFGDIIDVNCTLTPKSPSATIVLYWNAKPISEKSLNHELFQFVQLHLNSTLYNEVQTFPVLVQLRCSAVLNDIQHSISKAVFLKLKPNPATKSAAAELSDSFILILNLTLLLTRKRYITNGEL